MGTNEVEGRTRPSGQEGLAAPRPGPGLAGFLRSPRGSSSLVGEDYTASHREAMAGSDK